MNRRRLIALAAASALLAPSFGEASAPPAPSASAAPPASDEGETLEAKPPEAAESKSPSAEEWKSAAHVKLAHDVSACNAHRVREWLKIHCSGFPAAGISLVAGTRTGILVWVDQSGGEGNEAMKTPRDADIVFPVRRGDGRVFQIAQFGEGYDGPIGWNTAYTVSEQWAAGEQAPIVTVR